METQTQYTSPEAEIVYFSDDGLMTASAGGGGYGGIELPDDNWE